MGFPCVCKWAHFGGSREENLNRVWNRISHWYEVLDVSTKYRTLKLSMFEKGPGGYPCLRGKASEVKHLGPVLLAVWQEGMNHEIPLHVALKLALETGVQLDEWIDD